MLQPASIHLLPNVGSRQWSYDPEKEIFGEQAELSRREARSKNTAIAVGVAVVATAVAVAATSDGDDFDDDDDGLNLFDDDGDTFVFINNGVPPPPLQYYPPNVHFWKDFALRKTTLEKKQKVGGKVVFPRMDEAREFTMIIPVGEEEIRANFKQRIFQP